jgi:hypothetical protein
MACPAAAARRHSIDTAIRRSDAAILRLFAYWQNSRLPAQSGAKPAGKPR